MSQVSYGTITIVDTTDIARIYMVYAKSVSNTTPPSDELTWSESIASAPGEGDFIWQKTVVEKAITEEKTYSDPVCVTGSSGQGVEKIINYYCNYGQGQPEENYSGWQLEIPEYDGSKPNYWTKVVVIYSDDTREDFQASGTIATFESEKVGTLDSLEVSLEPIQDLHGYDKPWSEGAGKNKLDQSAYTWLDATSYSNGVFTAETLSTFSSAMVRLYKNGAVVNTINKAPTEGSRVSINVTVDDTWDACFIGYRMGGASNIGGLFNKPSVADGTYTVSFMADKLPSTSVYGKFSNIQFESGSTATSYEPYTNICPISGWDSVDTHKTGTNLFNKDNYNVLNAYINNGVIVISSSRSLVWLECKPNTTYTISRKAIVANERFGFGWTTEQPDIGTTVNDTTPIATSTTVGATITRTLTTGADAKYLAIWMGWENRTEEAETMQIEVGSTATAYEPYDGQTITTTLPTTVYGGTLDVVSGVLTVDRAYVSMDGATQYSQTGDYTLYRKPNNPFSTNTSGGNALSNITNNFGNIATGLQDTKIQFPTGGTGYIYVSVPNGLDISSVTAVYTLATPTTIQCDPQTVQTLIGDNNVWGGGTVELRGHTISKRDVMIYKDNGLTDIVNKSAEANTNAAEALEKANDGIVSTTQLWYQTNSTSALSVPTSHSQVDQGTITYNNWRSARPNNNVDSYKYYYYCYEYLHGDGTYTYSAEAILDTSNLSQYQIGALTAKVKNFWWDSNGAHIASGKNGNEVATNTISTYGYHALMGLTGISFNYDNAKVVDLNSTTPSLDFYQPPTISGSTVTQGKKTMMLSANALKFYNPTDGTTEQAVLDTNGLILKKGGVKAGTANQSGFIYLSTDPYGNYSINGSTSISDWKQIIGTKFGVRADGTLYASNANIQGILTAGAGSTIGPWSITATSIYKGNATHGAAGNGNMYFGNDGLSISNTFKVSSAGVLSAAGAQISGNITANSLIIEEGASIGGLNTDHIDNFQETIDLIDNKIIKNASYIYASDPEDTSTYSETNTQLQYQALKLVSSEESLIWELNPVWASGVADNYITTISGSGGISIRNENEPGSYMELEPHIMNFYDNNSVQASIGNIPDEHIYGIIAEALNAYGSGAGVKFDNAKNNSEDEVRGRFIWVIRDNGHLSLKKY